MKTCKRCEIEKPESDFYAKDSTCKECRKKLVRENRAKKADYYREYDRRRYQEDPNVRARHRRYRDTPEGKESMARSREKWLKNNEVKRAAHILLGNAVRDGRITKAEACEACGSRHPRLHGHHDDYLEPLVVRWLCPDCHSAWHQKNGEAKFARLHNAYGG